MALRMATWRRVLLPEIRAVRAGNIEQLRDYGCHPSKMSRPRCSIQALADLRHLNKRSFPAVTQPLRIHPGHTGEQTPGRPQRPRALSQSSSNARGYKSKSSPAPNCVGFTKIDTATALTFGTRPLHQRQMPPVERRPWVGTRPSSRSPRFSARHAFRIASMLRKICMARPRSPALNHRAHSVRRASSAHPAVRGPFVPGDSSPHRSENCAR